MDFGLNEEQRLVIQSFRKFLDKEVRRSARSTRTRCSRRKCATTLSTAPSLRVHGRLDPGGGRGMGLDQVTIGLLYEELSRVFPGLAGVSMIGDTTASVLVLDGRRPEGPLSRKIGSGEIIPCLAISEPDVGSNPTEMRTRAEKDGAGYRISGQKAWISNGAVSDLCYCVTRTGRPEPVTQPLPRRAGARGLQGPNVPQDRAERLVDGRALLRQRVCAGRKHGGRAREGLKTTLQIFERARCFLAIMSVGIGQAALDAAIQYARERKQWGSPSPAPDDPEPDRGKWPPSSTALASWRTGLFTSSIRPAVRHPDPMAKYYATEVAVTLPRRRSRSTAATA